MRGNVSRLEEASTAIVQGQSQTREHQEMTTLNVQQLLVEWMKAQREMEELRVSMRGMHAADTEREQQTRRVHEAEPTREAQSPALALRELLSATAKLGRPRDAWLVSPGQLRDYDSGGDGVIIGTR